jgi:hypothetical protein
VQSSSGLEAGDGLDVPCCECVVDGRKQKAEKAEAAAKLASSQPLHESPDNDEQDQLDVSPDDEQGGLFGTSGYHIGTASVALRHPAGTNPSTNFLAAAPHGIRGGGVQLSQGFMLGLKQSLDDVCDRLVHLERSVLSMSQASAPHDAHDLEAKP